MILTKTTKRRTKLQLHMLKFRTLSKPTKQTTKQKHKNANFKQKKKQNFLRWKMIYYPRFTEVDFISTSHVWLVVFEKEQNNNGRERKNTQRKG